MGDMLHSLATIADIVLHTLATIADIDLICSIIYGSNMGDMLHSLATVADIVLILFMVVIWVTCCNCIL